MTDNVQQEKKQQSKLSFFDYVFEVIGWLQIVASPLLAGVVVGALIYFSNPSGWRLVLALVIGLIVGIIFATRVWKKHGTMHFVSRVMATPELDNLDEEKDKIVEKEKEEHTT